MLKHVYTKDKYKHIICAYFDTHGKQEKRKLQKRTKKSVKQNKTKQIQEPTTKTDTYLHQKCSKSKRKQSTWAVQQITGLGL